MVCKVKNVQTVYGREIFLFSLSVPVQRAMVMSAPLEVQPRMRYEDGQRTDQQERSTSGVPIWKIVGLAPVVEVGSTTAIDTDASVVVASEREPDLPAVSAGESLEVRGVFHVTRAQFGQVSGRFELEEIK